MDVMGASLGGVALMIAGAALTIRSRLGGDAESRQAIAAVTNDPSRAGALHSCAAYDASSACVAVLRVKLGLPAEFFDEAVLPVLEAYAVFAPSFAADASDKYVRSGAAFHQRIAVASAALEYRRGQILPPGAPTEALGERAHRWTYALLLAAVLRSCHNDLGRLGENAPNDSCGHGSALNAGVESRGAQQGCIARTRADSARDGRATLPWLCLFVPVPILEWLQSDAAVMVELCRCLCGGDKSGTGPLGSLVQRAERAVRAVQSISTEADGPRSVAAVTPCDGDGTTTGAPVAEPPGHTESSSCDIRCSSAAATAGTIVSTEPEYLEDFEIMRRLAKQKRAADKATRSIQS